MAKECPVNFNFYKSIREKCSPTVFRGMKWSGTVLRIEVEITFLLLSLSMSDHNRVFIGQVWTDVFFLDFINKEVVIASILLFIL